MCVSGCAAGWFGGEDGRPGTLSASERLVDVKSVRWAGGSMRSSRSRRYEGVCGQNGLLASAALVQ